MGEKKRWVASCSPDHCELRVSSSWFTRSRASLVLCSLRALASRARTTHCISILDDGDKIALYSSPGDSLLKRLVCHPSFAIV
ncbi:hypothetical protein ElyMa_006441500 [Elysia marginata]|uniref:Uncharacterized protein n=1 Tax=Elysia marginata TaxID=1093978 RepID=A0AAV4HXX2_9GAST|nr:hypothetical protein ElyMa_006441500 [Elysia marginata]